MPKRSNESLEFALLKAANYTLDKFSLSSIFKLYYTADFLIRSLKQNTTFDPCLLVITIEVKFVTKSYKIIFCEPTKR